MGEYSGEKFDLIVVGGGVMGSSTAYAAAKRGLKVLLLEQFDFLHYLGSSHGESRTIRATYPEDYYPPMVIEAARLWEEAELEAGYNVYFKTSHLDFGPSDNPSLLHVISSCKTNGIPHRVLDAQQVFDEMSGRIRVPDDWIGVATDLGGVIKPTKAVSMFQALAMKHGAILRDRIEVKGIQAVTEEGGGILVSTAGGNQFRASKCAITAGAWMKNLVKTVTGKHLPIQPIETTVFYWRIKEGHASDFTINDGKFPTFASYGNPYIYGTPSLEFPGLIKIPVHGGQDCNPDERKWKAVANGDAMEELRQWIRGRFGDLVEADGGPVITQSCLYSMTPDEDYVIDFLGGEFGKDVAVAGGFSGHGFKMAPAVGRIVAEMLFDGEVKLGGVDLKYFKIERFDGDSNGNCKGFADQVCICPSS